MKVQTAGLQDNGFSLLLMLFPSEELLAEQVRVASMLPGQVPVNELHITLMSSPTPHQAYPAPPEFVAFHKEPTFVTDGNKTSVYLRVTDASQHELAQYVSALEEEFNMPERKDKNRIFHVSLTNLVGMPNESVAHVWEYPSKAL